ncbi:hypothetical protein CTAYLR_005483 [Chrysophaeum taylorii]|uniref:NYN domain-containing protein n=1 Tax=Chrysophaeum taylorii TaxID=2483200 RepID=A0AAD7U5Q2_9STRA|nr:hypothetical protein CTAYLR_005483 [Chrysophaeum taylorii]
METVLVVDAAYIHSAPDVNAWSQAELDRVDPARLRRRVEAATGLAVTSAVWCGAKDGRFDSGGAKLERSLRRAGFEARFRRMKVDEVLCRNRDCRSCRHRANPIRVRRQSGVDVDICTRTLEIVFGASAAATVILVAGDGDLAPLAETLLRAGFDLFVFAYPRSLSPELADLANASKGVVALDASFFRTNKPPEKEDAAPLFSEGGKKDAPPTLVPTQVARHGHLASASPLVVSADDTASSSGGCKDNPDDHSSVGLQGSGSGYDSDDDDEEIILFDPHRARHPLPAPPPSPSL